MQEMLSAAPRLTWVEICARYPNQWVVLGDIDYGDDVSYEIRSAVVIAHGAGRVDVLRRASPRLPVGGRFAHLYTGRVQARGALLVGVRPSRAA